MGRLLYTVHYFFVQLYWRLYFRVLQSVLLLNQMCVIDKKSLPISSGKGVLSCGFSFAVPNPMFLGGSEESLALNKTISSERGQT